MVNPFSTESSLKSITHEIITKKFCDCIGRQRSRWKFIDIQSIIDYRLHERLTICYALDMYLTLLLTVADP